MRRFKDRIEAGQLLAQALARYKNHPNLLVLALPRGGVPIAHQVAKGLNAPMDIFVVRKLGMPGHEELAMGAIASGSVRIINQDVVREYNIPDDVIEAVTAKEQEELERREQKYRQGLPPLDVKNKTVILVDDGLATGATMWAAVSALREQQPALLIVGVPAAAKATCDAFRPIVDDIVCVITPEPFYAVGIWYEDFSQTTDEEVHQLMKQQKAKR